MKRVLIHSLVFSPDSVSTSYLYSDIVLGLIDNGFKVVVLTSTPHYNTLSTELEKQPLSKHLFGLYYTSNYHGVKVFHVPLRKYKSTSNRLLSFIYWHFVSAIIGISLRKISFILSPSPPLSIGLVSLLIGRIKGAKVVYNVQEVYPDLLIKKGKLKFLPIIRLLHLIEKFIYDFSNAVVTIDEVFYNKISPRFKDTSKLRIIPNFVDTNLYKPISKGFNLSKPFKSVNNKIKVLYAGNIGYYQDWEPLFFAARELLSDNIEFWIVGEGVKKEYLIEQVKALNLTNVRIFPYQPRDSITQVNNCADIHFISINQEMEDEGFPSKVYTSMACAKPLIVLTGTNSPLYRFLVDKNCSELISSNRNIEFVNSIRKLAMDENLRLQLGFNGLQYIKKFFSKKVVISKYIDLFNSL